MSFWKLVWGFNGVLLTISAVAWAFGGEQSTLRIFLNYAMSFGYVYLMYTGDDR